MQQLVEDFSHLGMISVIATVGRIAALIQVPEATYAELGDLNRDLVQRFHDELTASVFFSLDPTKRRYLLEPNLVFGEGVATAFPSAIPEIEEAGKCLALNRNTARRVSRDASTRAWTASARGLAQRADARSRQEPGRGTGFSAVRGC